MERQGLPMLNHVLQHTLRSLCCDSQWVYAVFWRILPRNYPPPKWENEGGVMDRSKGNKRNWILVWEDGFCDFSACSAGREAKPGARHGAHTFHSDDSTEPAMHPELFFKMSHEVYNYGEGLMGKVAADNSHKWVYREPMEHEISFLSPWHGSLDPHPRTWEAQFKAGIQTVAVISVREGLVQLGSLKKVVEDLNFVILMQRKFHYLQSIPGVFVPHPSPHPTLKRRDSMDGSPPSDLACWTGNKDQAAPNGLFQRSNSDPFRMATHTKQLGAGVLGIKRPPDSDIPLAVGTGREFPFLSPAANFSGSPRFNCGQTNRSPECPSPPKALNTGQNGNLSLIPSMSSLHNLLSKLPSVTAHGPETSNGSLHSSSPSVLSLSSQVQQSFPRNQPISPSSSSDSPLGMAIAVDQNNNNSSPRSSPPHPSSQSRCVNSNGAGDSGAGGPKQDSSRSRSETSTSQKHHQSSWHNSEFTDHASGMTERPNGANKDKLSSFLDSFDPDALSDLDLLDTSETYNSFLSEIIS